MFKNSKTKKFINVEYDADWEDENLRDKHQNTGAEPLIKNGCFLLVKPDLNKTCQNPKLCSDRLFGGKEFDEITDVIKEIAKKNKEEVNIDLFNGNQEWDLAEDDQHYYKILKNALQNYEITFLSFEKEKCSNKMNCKIEKLDDMKDYSELMDLNEFDGILAAKSNKEIDECEIALEVENWINGQQYVIWIGKNEEDLEVLGYLPKSALKNTEKIGDILEKMLEFGDYDDSNVLELLAKKEENFSNLNWEEVQE